MGCLMSIAEEIQRASADKTAPDLMRYLLVDQFSNEAAVTSSLRGRSIVVLSMIAENNPATRVVFCHAPNLYQESLDYRDKIIGMLRLSNVRIADNRETAGPSDGPQYVEDIWSEVWGGERVHSVQNLNHSLNGFQCWISAVYHRPYGDDQAARIADEGELVRVDALSGWTEEAVRAYMADHNLPPHPHIELKQPRPSIKGSAAIPTYHY